MFLHDRNTGVDFVKYIEENRNRFSTGVVHSFTGNAKQVEALLKLDLYIGINGCSLKTAENIEVMKTIPLDRMMIETDGPWCGIKRTHAGHGHIKTTWPVKKKEKYIPEMGLCVKDRCEPCHIHQVLEVICGARNLDIEKTAQQLYANTCKVFFPNHSDEE
jgi:TatD DNase family protein